MGPPRMPSRTRAHGAQVEHAGVVCHLPTGSLGGGTEECAALASGGARTGLDRLLLAAGCLRRDMASKVRDEADAIFANRDLAARSSDGRRDLADRRSDAVHQTTLHADAASGGEGRCP